MGGYFGTTGPLCIGDNSYAPVLTKKPRNDNEGEPLRQVQTVPLHQGCTPDVFFSFAPYRCASKEEEPYRDPKPFTRTEKVRTLDPECAFKPPGAVRHSTNKTGFEYLPHQDTLKDPKEIYTKYKDVLPERNFYTSPPRKGGGGVYTRGVLFGFDKEGNRKFPEMITDENGYARAKMLRNEELKRHREKMPEQPFSAMQHGGKLFHPTSSTHQYEVPTHVPRESKIDKVSKCERDAPFKPSEPMKKGALYGVLAPFPEHMTDPIPGPPKRKGKPGEGEPEPPAPFRRSNPRRVCNPMPSIATMTRNMRSERPQSFARSSLA